MITQIPRFVVQSSTETARVQPGPPEPTPLYRNAALSFALLSLPLLLLAQGTTRPIPDSLQRIEKLSLSGAVYFESLKELGALPPRVAPAGSPPQVLPASAATYNVNETNDSLQDIEPTTITLGNRTTTAYLKYAQGANGPNAYYTTTTDLASFSGGMLPLPPGFPAPYEFSGDPYLAEDPNAGFGPNRIYCVGTLFNQGTTAAANAIGVWVSNAAGTTFPSGPTLVNSDTGSFWFYDKPNIAVSLHSGSLGYVYVTYTGSDRTHGDAQSVFVSRSTNGGASFPQTVQVPAATGSTPGAVGGPQVVVSPFSGTVYLVWADYVNGRIALSQSSDYGLTWSAIVSGGPTGRNLYTPTSQFLLGGKMRAQTLPAARFNWPANSVSMAWHERNASGNADVFYAANAGGSWTGPTRVNQLTPNDQFMPALDFDGSGNVTVSYYDTRDDLVFARQYATYYTQLDAGGGLLQTDTRISPFLSDPSTLTTVQYFIGDYHDLWFTNGSWHDVSILIPSPGQSDVYLTVIQ